MEDENKKNDVPGQEEGALNEEESRAGDESRSGEEAADRQVFYAADEQDKESDGQAPASFPHEGDEFGPEAFADEPENAYVESFNPAAAATSSGAARLPWFLFAASVIAIGVILYIWQSGQGGLAGNAATVNGEKITKQEVYDIMYKQGGDAAIENLITEKLIAQEVDKKKLKAKEEDIEAELKTIKDQFPEEAQFNQALEQNGFTLDTLKKQISTQLEIGLIFESQMDLSDAKLKEYFDKNQESFGSPEQLEVSHILVEAKEDADKLLADLKGGADFATVAKEKSVDTGTKDMGGSLGFVARGQGLDQAFEDAAFKLNKGEMSEVVQSSFGFHIIKVTDKKEEVKPNFDTHKADVRKAMVGEEVNAKAPAWLEEIRTAAKVEKM
ncbi:MAG: PpiC-type peptidyl-prolyl cis-trans isomerase [Paenibacillaceae bacterium]|jgi:foldase protein PrsA|nr:PpiC-type peptidyl-prolyl cis-trans isomerase [Paenibacillaceae bacterium]